MSESLSPGGFPLNSIVFTNNECLKVILKKKEHSDDEPEHIFKSLGNFSLEVLAKSDPVPDSTSTQGRVFYLFKLNNKLFVDTLSFTSNINRFKEKIRPSFFVGSPNDLEYIVGAICAPFLLKADESNLIYIDSMSGWYGDDNMEFWIFKDRFVFTHDKGKKLKKPKVILFPNKDPDVMIEYGGKYIYLKKYSMDSLIPTYVEPEDYSLQQFNEEWFGLYNCFPMMAALLGWMLASMYREKVMALRRVSHFPFFLVNASTNMGKTDLLQMCMRIFGFDYAGAAYTQITPFVDMIEASRVSRLPIWRDEYKNEGTALNKESWLRSKFNCSASERGSAGQKVFQYPDRSTLLLSGEDFTTDTAGDRRFVRFRMKKEFKVPLDVHKKNRVISSENFAKTLPILLAHGFDEKVFLELMEIPLNTSNAPEDELMCYAMYGAVFGKELALWAIKEANKMHDLTKDDAINEKTTTPDMFFQALDSLLTEKGGYNMGYNRPAQVLEYFDFANDDTTVYFKLKSAQAFVNKNKHNKDYAWSPRALAGHMQEHYQTTIGVRKFRGISSRLMIFQDFNTTVPEGPLRELVERAKVALKEWEEYQRKINNTTY